MPSFPNIPRRKMAAGLFVVAVISLTSWIAITYRLHQQRQAVLLRARECLAQSNGILLEIPSFADTHSTRIEDRQVITDLGQALTMTSCQQISNMMEPAAGGCAIYVTPLHGTKFRFIISNGWMWVILKDHSVTETYRCDVEGGTVLQKFAAAAAFAYPLLSELDQENE